MATSLSLKPNLSLSVLTTNRRPHFHRTHFNGFPSRTPPLRGSLCVAQFGFKPDLLPDPDMAQVVIKELFGKAESLLYTIADAAVSSSTTVTTKQNTDWLSGITNYLETVLKVLEDGFSALHVPYAYGFAIILLTVLVKAVTFPLTKKQVESAMAMRSLQPQVQALQKRYAGNQERIQLETARLYKLAGINPLAGCLPTLATIPVWIGLYRALSNVADEGLLTEGFFWIPSLAGPTTIAARQNGTGISWLFPFIDGHPPLGWSDTLAYLILPVLLVVSQYISVQIMQSSQSNDPNLKNSQALTKFLPLMIGYFALSVPSGLSLYWLTNNILSTIQQVWLQKLGGAKNPVMQFTDIAEEEVQVQKPVSGSNTQKKSRQEEKLTPEGLHPGERFKQLKEQEARRRRQREEEKSRTEEALARGSQLTDKGDEIESNVLEKENGAGSALSVRVVVNGELSSQDSKEDPKTSMFWTEKNEVSSNFEGERRDEIQTHENIEKDAVERYKTTITAENTISEDTQQE